MWTQSIHGFRLGEPGRLLVPDRLGTICEKQRALGAVPALDRLLMQPLEQRGVALEGRVDPLVDRPFAGPVVAAGPQRVDHAHERDLGVLALVALGSTRSLARMSPPPSSMARGSLA